MNDQEKPIEVTDEDLESAQGGAHKLGGEAADIKRAKKGTVLTTNENIWICDTMERN